MPILSCHTTAVSTEVVPTSTEAWVKTMTGS
jgi:hypothetical protein